jgi:hypothetical protein
VVMAAGRPALNLRPHPYQRSTAKRRTIAHVPRSCGSVSAGGWVNLRSRCYATPCDFLGTIFVE